MDAWLHARAHAREFRNLGSNPKAVRRAYRSERSGERSAARAQVKADEVATANAPSIAAMNEEAARVREREQMVADSRLTQAIVRRERTKE